MTTQTLDSEASQALLRYTKQGIPFPAYLRDKLTPEQLAALSEQERRATVSVIDDNGRKQSDVIDEAVIEFAPTEVPRLDIGIHDFIDALAAEVTLGTILPFNFARETFKMMLLANCRPALSWFHTLHPRQYVILVSDSPGMGKGETFRRCSQTLIKDSYPIQFLDGDGIGSPEYACLALGGQWSKQKKVDGIEVHISTEPRIVHYDEGRKLFQKDTTGSSGQSDRGLVTLFTKLFESNAHSTGSFRNGRASIDKADVSLLLHFTRAGFDRSFAGSGATRDGFLSRCCIVADKSNPVKGDWRRVESSTVQSLITSARRLADQPVRDGCSELRQQYLTKLRALDHTFGSRLPFLFVQDLYARALFDDGVISADKVERAIAWTEHQFLTRQTLWPFDTGIDRNERMYLNLRAAYQKHGRLTHSQAMRLCNVNREGSGGAAVYNYAHRAMLISGEIENAGINRKRCAVFAWARES